MATSLNRMLNTFPGYDPSRFLPFDGDGEGGSGGGGGAGSGAGAGDGTQGAAGGDPKPATEQTITQSEMQRIAAREKDQGKRAALEEAAKVLGVTNLDEAKVILDEHRKAQDQQKTEAQRAREAADAEKAEAEKAKGGAALERHTAAVERQLIRALPAGLDDAALDKRVTKIAKLIEVEVGADADTIKSAIAELKKDMPEVFGAPTGKGGGAPNSDPAGSPPKPRQDSDAFARGAARAKGTGETTEDRFAKLLGTPAT